MGFSVVTPAGRGLAGLGPESEAEDPGCLGLWASLLHASGLSRSQSPLFCPYYTVQPSLFLSHQLWPGLSPSHTLAPNSLPNRWECFWPTQDLKPEGA